MKSLIATAMSSVLTFGSFALILVPQSNAAESTFNRMDAFSTPTTVPTQPKLETAQFQAQQETQVAYTVVPDVCTDYYMDGYGNIYWYSYYC
jgi:hypothetical protein